MLGRLAGRRGVSSVRPSVRWAGPHPPAAQSVLMTARPLPGRLSSPTPGLDSPRGYPRRRSIGRPACGQSAASELLNMVMAKSTPEEDRETTNPMGNIITRGLWVVRTQPNDWKWQQERRQTLNAYMTTTKSLLVLGPLGKNDQCLNYTEAVMLHGSVQPSAQQRAVFAPPPRRRHCCLFPWLHGELLNMLLTSRMTVMVITRLLACSTPAGGSAVAAESVADRRRPTPTLTPLGLTAAAPAPHRTAPPRRVLHSWESTLMRASTPPLRRRCRCSCGFVDLLDAVSSSCCFVGINPATGRQDRRRNDLQWGTIELLSPTRGRLRERHLKLSDTQDHYTYVTH